MDLGENRLKLTKTLGRYILRNNLPSIGITSYWFNQQD